MPNPYDLIAGRWDAGGRAFRQRRYVDLILEGLGRGARALDVGCGTGRPVAEYLVARGFRVELCEVDDPPSLGHVAIVARKPAR